MLEFFSDNTSPMVPELLRALVDANENCLPSYATDCYSLEARERFSELFGRPVDVFFTSSGTAANALAMATFCPPWKRALVQKQAHSAEAEAGAPEAAGGGLKLSSPTQGVEKLTAAQISAECAKTNINDPHKPRYGLVSVSQATEMGTVYSLDELRSISSAAIHGGLRLHMDGARFSNAAVSLQCTASELSCDVGFDALSFGIAKNGGGMGDAIILFDLEKAEELRFRQMRGGHLMAKNRFAAAQAVAILKNDLWRTLASRANQGAMFIAEALSSRGVRIVNQVQANIVFAALPKATVARLRKSGQPIGCVRAERFGLDAADFADHQIVRFLTSWSTDEAAVKDLLRKL